MVKVTVTGRAEIKDKFINKIGTPEVQSESTHSKS